MARHRASGDQRLRAVTLSANVLRTSRFRFLLLQLFFPSEDARLITGFFGFGDHSLALIGARNRRPRQNVIGIERENAPGRLDRAVKIFLGVVRLRESMQRVGEFRVHLERAAVFRDGFVELPLAEEINPRVVVVFRCHDCASVRNPTPC